MAKHELILTKVFTELRFTASLLYSDLKLLNGFVNFLKEYFDAVQYDSATTQISCVSEDKKLQGFFWNNRIVVDMDNPEYDNFKRTAKEIISQYCEIFDCNQFSRTGIRFNWVASFESIEEAKKLFYNKCFPFLKEIKAPVDIGTVSSAKCELNLNMDSKRRLNLAIYPSEVRTVGITIGPSGTQHETVNIEGLMLDSDLFEEGKISINNYLNLLDAADKETHNKAFVIYDIIGLAR